MLALVVNAARIARCFRLDPVMVLGDPASLHRLVRLASTLVIAHDVEEADRRGQS